MYAHWDKQYTITLTYDSYGGSVTPTADTYTGTASSHTFTVTNTSPGSKTGHTFLGWSIGSTSSIYQPGDTVTLTVSTTAVAKWDKNTYTVTFDRQGGSGGTASVTATYGAAMPPLTPPTREGYTFGGYYT